jgi:hypothetical protein
MSRKLMIVILAVVAFWGFFASNILAGTPGKITPPKDPCRSDCSILPHTPKWRQGLLLDSKRQ